MIKNTPKILIFSVFIIGFLLRFYKFETYSFGFDQVQILNNAIDITKFNPVLVGPRTGPASMFTGPFIYYLTAFLHIFISNEFSLIGSAMVIYVLNFVGIITVTSKYLNPKRALLFLFLWSTSIFVVYFERVVWNPNLVFLTSCLFFFPTLHWWEKKTITKIDYIFTGIGGFLAYQSHFSALILPFMVAVILALGIKKRDISGIHLLISSIVGLTISLIPTIIFDMRNSWLNYNGLVNLLFQNNKFHINQQISLILSSFQDSIMTTLMNSSKLLLNISDQFYSLWLGVILIFGFISFVFFKSKLRGTSKFILYWISFIMFSFTFYVYDKTEYYYLVQFPAFILMIVEMAIHMNSRKLIFCCLLFSVISITSVISSTKNEYMSISDQLYIKNYIDEINTSKGVNNIVIDIPFEHSYGLKYLFRDYPYSSNGVTLHITTKDRAPSYAELLDNSSLSIWEDHRKKDMNTITMSSTIISSPKNIELYEDRYRSRSPFQSWFRIYRDDRFIGYISLLDLNFDTDVDLCTLGGKCRSYSQNELGLKSDQWIMSFIDGEKVEIFNKRKSLIIIYSHESDFPISKYIQIN